jgi:predicted anti-sigma-YlaC factor YlaD
MRILSSPLNCQQATLLLERRADQALSLPLRAQLWAHLRLCPYCRRYEHQSQLLSQQAKPAAAVPAALALPEATRRRLQQVLGARPAPGTPNDLREAGRVEEEKFEK